MILPSIPTHSHRIPTSIPTITQGKSLAFPPIPTFRGGCSHHESPRFRSMKKSGNGGNSGNKNTIYCNFTGITHSHLHSHPRFEVGMGNLGLPRATSGYLLPLSPRPLAQANAGDSRACRDAKDEDVGPAAKVAGVGDARLRWASAGTTEAAASVRPEGMLCMTGLMHQSQRPQGAGIPTTRAHPVASRVLPAPSSDRGAPSARIFVCVVGKWVGHRTGAVSACRGIGQGVTRG